MKPDRGLHVLTLGIALAALVALIVAACSSGEGGKPLIGGGAGVLTKEPATITVSVQDARNLYARVDTVYKTLASAASTKCATNQLKATECAALTQINAQAVTLNQEVRMKLDNPRAELDTAKVIRLLEVVASIAGKLL